MWLTLTVLIVLLLLIGFWRSTMHAKEMALKHAKELCKAYNVQLLDDTVCIRRLTVTRNEMGRLSFKRVYSFEYLLDTQQRLQGRLTMIGTELLDQDLTIERAFVGTKKAPDDAAPSAKVLDFVPKNDESFTKH